MSLRVVAWIFCILINNTYGTIASLNNNLFSGDFEFFDLTHPFDNATIYWPGNRNFEFTQKIATVEDDGTWFAANEFAAAEHGGTHLDAPYHFQQTGKYVGDIEVDKLIVPLLIVDISSQVNDDPNFILYKHHLDHLLLDLGRPYVIIFKFGWSKFYGDKKYLGQDERTKALNFPGLSSEIAEWITSSYKNVVGVGVDVASVDPGSSGGYPVHKIFAHNGLYNMENVKLLEDLPECGCTALVMPMKIQQGTGAPLRLTAICPKRKPSKF